MKNKWIIGAVILGIIIIGIGIWIWTKSSQKSSTPPSNQNQATGTDSYFAEDAKVMYFYSDGCHWCQKEKAEVLPKLGAEGYKVKPMNVGTDTSLWTKYNIEGTPTFVAANGDRLVGYQEYDALKKFLDSHK